MEQVKSSAINFAVHCLLTEEITIPAIREKALDVILDMREAEVEVLVGAGVSISEVERPVTAEEIEAICNEIAIQLFATLMFQRNRMLAAA